MFSITSAISSLVSCRKHILRKKNGIIVSPSQLTESWFKNTTQSNLDKVRLLYVGRIRVEKGIFSFLKLFKDLREDIHLSIVTTKSDRSKINNLENINCIESQSEEYLIKNYDENNILILPSFTEGHPQVLDEALARLRPVIVFDEIKHVKRNREGVFTCKRNTQELNSMIDHILKNYSEIQSKMKTNNLPKKEVFIDELKSIINEQKK
jgi:glycosyltransferase involved in cell wall biosynthesis